MRRPEVNVLVSIDAYCVVQYLLLKVAIRRQYILEFLLWAWTIVIPGARTVYLLTHAYFISHPSLHQPSFTPLAILSYDHVLFMTPRASPGGSPRHYRCHCY
jgi:hypothetical protein